MADVDFDEFEDGYDPPASGRMGRFVHLAGAGCSVALIVGMAIWGYKLAVRDVSGIPVVRALPDPMRVAPVTPGGVETMHQGLSVNAVAAAGTVSPLPESLILAPPEIDLAADDAPGLGVVEQAPAGAAVVASASGPVPPQVAVENVVAAPVATEAAANVDAEALAAEDGVADMMTEDDAVAAALASALGSEAPAPLADEGGGIGAKITSSPRPHLRPAAIDAAAPATEGEAVAVVAAEVDPTTIAVGTRLVQLGAFDDEAAARAEWGNLAAKFPDLLPAKSMVIQPAQSGGRTFYRLRAMGFENEDEARKFCAVFLTQNASCIPVTQK